MKRKAPPARALGHGSPPCSVVIRSYNEERHIARLLVGILNQSVAGAEIILVDSGSTDATLAIAARYPVQILHIDPAAFSFGRSLNVGCRAAHGEFVVIASAHVYPVYRDWLERLLAPFVDERVAAVYGKQRGDSTTRFSKHQIFRHWFPEVSAPQPASPFCSNANAAIRRGFWLRRAYDEDLPALEDVEWATWALAQGYRLAYQAEAEVIHIHDESPRAVFNRYRREAMALKRIQPQEHFGVVDLVRLMILHVSLDLVDLGRERHRAHAEVLDAFQARRMSVGIGGQHHLRPASQHVSGHLVGVADDQLRAITGLAQHIRAAAHPDQHRLVLLDERLQALQIAHGRVFFADDHDVAAGQVDVDVRDADSVDEQRALATDELDRVAGERLQVLNEPALGLVHQVGDLFLTVFDTDDQSPVSRVHGAVVHPYPRAVLDLLEDIRSGVVDQPHAVRDEHLGSLVRVAPRDGP